MRTLLQISSKYKLFSILLLFSTAVLALYLFLIVRLFLGDRVANVFESSRVVSSALSSQVRLELNSWTTELRTIAQDTEPTKGTIGQIGRFLFKESPRLQGLWVYKMVENGNYDKASQLVKDQLGSLNIGFLEEKFPELLKAARFNHLAIQVVDLSSNEKYACRLASVCKPVVLLAVLHGDPYSMRHQIEIAMIQADTLFKIFGDSHTHRAYLIDSTGKALLGPGPLSEGLTMDFSAWSFFKKAKVAKLVEGAEETLSAENVPMLVSYAQIDVGSLMVISIVKKSVALRGIQILVIKSLLFFVILVSMASIAGLFLVAKAVEEPRSAV